MARKEIHPHTVPVIVAGIVALFGLIGLLSVDYGSKPKVKHAAMIHYGTTVESAAAVGATVAPTAPKPPIEPVAPGPKSVQPAIPNG
jgi:Flp pilus assembly protein CpaB